MGNKGTTEEPLDQAVPDLEITRGGWASVAAAEDQEPKTAPSPRFPLIIPRLFGRNAAAGATVPRCSKRRAETTFCGHVAAALSANLFFRG